MWPRAPTATTRWPARATPNSGARAAIALGCAGVFSGSLNALAAHGVHDSDAANTATRATRRSVQVRFDIMGPLALGVVRRWS